MMRLNANTFNKAVITDLIYGGNDRTRTDTLFSGSF